MMQSLLITDAKSGLSVRAVLLPDKAPANAAFLWRYLEIQRDVPGIHAMWTGPEISCPVPPAHLTGADWAVPLPQENATLHPQPGDIVLSYLPPRVWGGGPDPVFDIGLYYGPGARLFFQVGWIAGSVVAQIRPEDRAALAIACARIRQTGACTVTFSRGQA